MRGENRIDQEDEKTEKMIRLHDLEKPLYKIIEAFPSERLGDLTDFLGGKSHLDDRKEDIFAHTETRYQDGSLHIYVAWKGNVRVEFDGNVTPETEAKIKNYISELKNKLTD